MHNYDARNFYYKWIQDIRGAQVKSTGYIPNGAPWQPGCGGGVAWGAAIHIMPWEFYLQYGTVDILQENYEAMKGYISYMESWVDEEGIMLSQATGKNGLPLRWLNLGEWSWPAAKVPDDMVHTFYFWRCSDITARVAAILGHDEEATHYRALTKKAYDGFHQKFYNADSASYGNGGGNIFALRMGVPPERYDNVVASLRKDIINNDGHLDTGIFGTQFFFEILAENGMQELAYEAMNKRTEPGYGHWLELGATTTREDWNSSGSHNHPMFGGGLVWFYRKLAGMQVDSDSPGYKHIIFKPQPVQPMKFATYFNETLFGKAGIFWKNEDDTFVIEVEVPFGSTATVYIPSNESNTITEGEMDIKKSKDITVLGFENNYTLLEVGSGTYRFQVQ
jgi:alpha-L-rhamnosidase